MFILFLLILVLLAVWNWRLRRKVAKQLQVIGKMPLTPPTYWENRAFELETALLMEQMRLSEAETFLSHGLLCYSHSVGLCVKDELQGCCVPLDDAIFRNLTKEVAEK